LRGAEAAKGSVLTFLDSHIEATPGWLEPLLDRIAKDKTTVVCPIIDMIDDTTFQFLGHTHMSNVQVGGFDWGMVFRWETQPESERKRKKDQSEPTRSPTMVNERN
jgi:polypeptide N-acetylgalactosaminyltransferase